VIHGTWAEDIEAHSGSGVDAVDEALKEQGPVLLTVVRNWGPVKASGTSLTELYGVGPIVAATLIGYSG
jgi:hypothetical protein